MTFRRQLTVNPTTYKDVLLKGFARAYRPEQLSADVRQGDQEVAILDDELVAAGINPPKVRDLMIIDGRTWSVQGAETVADGEELIGWNLTVRGG